MYKDKPILVVFTGGTIGSAVKDGIICVDNETKYILLEQFASEWTGSSVEFETIEPLSLLSENATPDDWSKLIMAIRGVDVTRYSGVVVTHGTDTLPYASSALAFGLADLPIAIIMVSSDKPLSDRLSNGMQNFMDAIHLIKHTNLKGTYVVYRNPDGKSYLHIGSRLTQALPFIHSFRSEKDSHVVEICNGSICYRMRTNIPTKSKLEAPATTVLEPKYSNKILYIRPYPGLNYGFYDLDTNRPNAIVHDLYHCGTASTCPALPEHSILRFAEQCANRNIDLFIAPAPGYGDMYESSKELHDFGVIPLNDIAIEAAIVKIMLLYGNHSDRDYIRDIMIKKEIFHEIIR